MWQPSGTNQNSLSSKPTRTLASSPEFYGNRPAEENPLMQLSLDPAERLKQGIEYLKNEFIKLQEIVVGMPNSVTKIAALEDQVTLGKLIVSLSNGGVEFLLTIDTADLCKTIPRKSDARTRLTTAVHESNIVVARKALCDLVFDPLEAETSIKDSAITALRLTTDSDAIEKICLQLSSNRESNRSFALRCLHGTTDSKAVLTLIDFALDRTTDSVDSEAAVQIVRRSNSTPALARLFGLAFLDLPRKKYVAQMLQGTMHEPTIDNLIHVIREHSARPEFETAKDALRAEPSAYAVQSLIQLLSSDMLETVETAAILLPKADHKGAQEALCTLAKDSNFRRAKIGISAMRNNILCSESFELTLVDLVLRGPDEVSVAAATRTLFRAPGGAAPRHAGGATAPHGLPQRLGQAPSGLPRHVQRLRTPRRPLTSPRAVAARTIFVDGP